MQRRSGALFPNCYDRRYVFPPVFPRYVTARTHTHARTYVRVRDRYSVAEKAGDRCETFSNGPASARQPV